MQNIINYFPPGRLSRFQFAVWRRPKCDLSLRDVCWPEQVSVRPGGQLWPWGWPGGLPRLHHHRTLRCSEPSLHWNVSQFISNFLQKKYIKVGGMVTQSNWVVDASITQKCRPIRFKSNPITLIHCEIIHINPAQCSFIQCGTITINPAQE